MATQSNTSSCTLEVIHSVPLSDQDVKRELQAFLRKNHVREGLSCDHLHKLQQLHENLKSSVDIQFETPKKKKKKKKKDY